MGRLALLLATLTLALAGCIEAASVEPASVAALAVDGAAPLAPGIAHRWNGSLAAPGQNAQSLVGLACWTPAPCEAPSTDCGARECAALPFEVRSPASAVTLTVRWPFVGGNRIDAWIEDESGAIVALADNRYLSPMAAAARLDDPAIGKYVAVLAARYGDTSWEAALLVEPLAPAEAAARPLLPNLVTLTPTDLTLETPDYMGVSYFVFDMPGIKPVVEATGARGCRADEVVERQDMRCLRFSNAVGNVGEGPLDVRLPAGSLEFYQRVQLSDGTFEDSPGGPAEWHPMHAHWHNAATNLFTIHPYDAEMKTAGDPLHEGKKGGICFADIGLVDVGLANTMPGVETGWGCFQPGQGEQEWRMGISPGWYDMYELTLGDQYVDITGLADGTYTLCSGTNVEGTLLESDATDNVACTPFRLTGNDIELIEPAPYHAMPR